MENASNPALAVPPLIRALAFLSMALKFISPTGLPSLHIIPKHNHLRKLQTLSTSPSPPPPPPSKAFALSEGAEGGGVTEEDPPPASFSGKHSVPLKKNAVFLKSIFYFVLFCLELLINGALFLMKDHYLLLGRSWVCWSSSLLLAPPRPLMVSDSFTFSMTILDLQLLVTCWFWEVPYCSVYIVRSVDRLKQHINESYEEMPS